MIKYTVFQTDLGWMGLVSTDIGISASVLPQPTREMTESKIFARVGFQPKFCGESFAFLEGKIAACFRGECPDLACKIDWSWATPFQKTVLEIVRNITPGKVLSYGEVAAMAGSPEASRAVGGALASNRIPVIIPCHRVIRKDGTLGGFTGAGIDVKARLLMLEGAILPCP